MGITRTTLKILLVSLLEILMIEVCFSNGDCDIRGNESCYFLLSYGAKRNWDRARQLCKSNDSYLPIIRSREEQTSFETYLEKLNSTPRINAVWTSGKRKILNEWTWINGQRLDHSISISSNASADKTHAIINWSPEGNLIIIKPANPWNSALSLCQYEDRECNGQQYEVSATNGCLIPSANGDVSWYGARNECLSKGGDLAVLTDKDLQNLKNHLQSHYQYWIGLRKTYWVWQTQQGSSALEEEEVKYTKWAIGLSMLTEGELCISINTTDGHWRASICNLEGSSVVCEKQVSTTIASTTPTSGQRSVPTSSTATTTAITTAKLTSSTGKTHPSTTISSTSRRSIAWTLSNKTASNFPSTTPTTTTGTSISSTMNERDDISSTFNAVPAAVGTALAVIIVLCIIIVILVVKCRKSKSSNNKKESAQMDTETKDKKTKEENPSTTTATEERSIYADIPPLAENTANDTVKGGQKGTVYASLDFNQGVTYAEPSKLYANTQNVSGPLYAEPSDTTGNGTARAGSSSTAEVKIGPMGDVYALPTTKATPSSAKTTERPIYANT